LLTQTTESENGRKKSQKTQNQAFFFFDFCVFFRPIIEINKVELGTRPEINRQRCAGIGVPAKEAMKEFTRGKCRLKSLTLDRTSRPSRFDDLFLAESLKNVTRRAALLSKTPDYHCIKSRLVQLFLHLTADRRLALTPAGSTRRIRRWSAATL
jgi:hypothetical protein